jgi:hypothetical protein
LTRAVMREAAEIEQGTTGLVRPVTINLCGLVLSRFSSGLPRRFRGGILRGFLRESLLLPEVRDVAEKIIPNLITDNITKRPRTIAEMALATGLMTAAIRACMRRLGESDRAIVRPLDEEQETWEISHDFLAPLLDAIVARRTVSLWRRVRPWLPWAAAGIVGVVALAVPWLTKPDPTVELRRQGWSISETKEGLDFKRNTEIPPESIAILRTLPPPYSIDLSVSDVEDISAFRELKGLTGLDLSFTQVADISALQELQGLTDLDLEHTNVTDISALRELKGLRTLNIGQTQLADISALRELKSLTELNLGRTKVANLSALRELKRLTMLVLDNTQVTEISPLQELNSLAALNLGSTNVEDISALQGLKGLTALNLGNTKVTNISALRELKGLKELYLTNTKVTDISPLEELTGLRQLDLRGTKMTNVSALQRPGLRILR